MYYGLTHPEQIHQHARAVCDVIGNGKNNAAIQFLQEIAAVETHSGTLRDRHAVRLGIGLMQIDRICFVDVMKRTKISVWDSITEALGIEINVDYEMIAYSPLLSILFARLHLKLIPDEIPANRLERAAYWKKFYNTEAGAGTVDHYMKSCDAYL